MTLRTLLAGTAIATLALFTGGTAISGLSFTSQAEAAVNISFSVFYDNLASDGDWVRYHDAYVFVPDVDAGWRPYTEGHWVYTKRYGWMWVSDEPFGWATYHYGRWGHADDIGWYWVPGTRWAPAWVSWRRSNDYIVWAPLPPARGGADVSISISVGDIPDDYWVAVPARDFLAPDIEVVVVHEEREIRRVIERTEYVGTPRITNNVVINNVIDVDVVQKVTGREVTEVEVRTTEQPAKAAAAGDQVTVFQGEVAADADAKPKEVKKADEVRKAKRGGGKDATSTDTKIPAPDTQTLDTTEPAPAVKAPGEQAVTPEPETGKTKGKAAKTVEEPADTADTPDVPKKRKPAAKAETPQDEPADTAETPEQPKPKAKKPAAKAEGQDQDGADVTGTTEPAPPKEKAKGKERNRAEEKGKGKGKGKSQACDPADADCEVQQ